MAARIFRQLGSYLRLTTQEAAFVCDFTKALNLDSIIAIFLLSSHIENVTYLVSRMLLHRRKFCVMEA